MSNGTGPNTNWQTSFAAHEQRWTQTFQRYESNATANEEAARSYASLLLRSALFLNAGGLVIGLPAILKFFDTKEASLFFHVTLAAIAFCIGLTLAAMSAWLAYHNHLLQAQSARHNRNLELGQINAQWQAVVQGQTPPAMTPIGPNRHHRWIDVTFILSNIVGFGSYLVLIGGVAALVIYFARQIAC